MIIDTKQEERIKLGKSYNFPPLNEGECYLNSQQRNEMDAEVGEMIKVYVDIYFLYQKLVDRYNNDYAPLIG